VGKKKKKKTPPAPVPSQGTSVNRLGVVVAILLIAGLVAAVVYVGKTTP
jgi:hypothetical protein